MTDQAEKKHSAFWGVMVIAGTVIGGGMFALPVDPCRSLVFGALLSYYRLVFNVTFRAIIIRSKLKLSRRFQF
ncbi:hypothetical protein GCM10029976_004780 [Kribbella albertanoniae]